MLRNSRAAQEGPPARRRPRAAREAYSLLVERAVEDADEASGAFSAARWEGVIEVGGHRIALHFEPEGWLRATAALSGDADELLARQAGIRHLAKIASGPALQVDVPAGRSFREGVVTVRDALRAAFLVLAGTALPPEASPPGAPSFAHALEAYAGSCPWPCAREEGRWRFEVATGGRTQRIVAEAEEGSLRLAAQLAKLADPAPISRQALAHLVLALSARLRLARGFLGPDRVGVEVVIPGRLVSADLIERAMAALAVAGRVARRECVALLDPGLAALYCTFHEHRRQEP